MGKGSASDSIPDLTNLIIGINPQYRILHFIAKGAWGKVFCAEKIGDPNNLYAIKCINRSVLDTFQKQFISDEVHLQMKCSETSQHVLQVHDIIQVDHDGLDILYIVSEYCHGGDLFDYIYGSPDSPESYVSPLKYNDHLIREISLQIIDAVANCHSQGVYHRDLKLDNILLRRDGSIAVCDFGFATTRTHTEDFGMGTIDYMSPEITNIYGGNQIMTGPADMWALGVILINIIKSIDPWDSATFDDTRFTDFRLRPATYFKDTLGVSEEMNSILTRIFTIHPDERMGVWELRERIANVKSFYAPTMKIMEEEISLDGLYTISPAPSYISVPSMDVDLESDTDSYSDADSEGPATPNNPSIKLVVMNPDEPSSFDLDGPFCRDMESEQKMEAIFDERSVHEIVQILARSMNGMVQ